MSESSILIKRILYEIGEGNKLNFDFLYNQKLEKISKREWSIIFIFSFITIIILSIWNIQLKHIFGFLLIAFIILLFKDLPPPQTDKLRFLNEYLLNNQYKESNLHLYPPIVDFMYDYRDFVFVNSQAYVEILVSINKILRFYDDIVNKKIGNPAKTLEVVEIEETEMLNNFQSFIYRLQSNFKNNKKLHHGMKKFQKIMKHPMDEMKKVCYDYAKDREFSIYTIPIQGAQPKPNDTKSFAFNPHYNYYT